MPSQTTSPPVTLTVLAALWVSLSRCGGSGTPWTGCDNGKLLLERDLPSDTVYWDCPGSPWPESIQRLPTIDTAYDPEPARQVCMDKHISYNHKTPNSGAYRPVRAESGEYFYCPPQRWLNNLHHGATVLLYHPCTPLRQRLLLSTLAQLCLPDYVITPHPELNKHMPIALVSWGRTLELSTMATSDVCDWLEMTATTGFMCSNDQSRKYNLLLTKPAMQHPCGEREQQNTHIPLKTKESLKRCCEQTLSSLLSGAMEAELDSRMKAGSMKKKKEEGKNRKSRAIIREKWQNSESENERENATSHDSTSVMNQMNETSLNPIQEVQESNSMLGLSAESLAGTMNASYHPDPKEGPSHPTSEMQNQNQSLTPSPTTLLRSYLLEHTRRPDSLGSRASESKSNVESQKETESLQRSPKHSDFKHPEPKTGNGVSADRVYFEHTLTTRPEAAHVNQEHTSLIHSAKQGRKDRNKQRDKDDMKENVKYSGKDNMAGGKMEDNEVVDVEEREVEHKQTHTRTHIHHKSEQTGFDSAPKTQSESPPQSQRRLNPQPASYLSNTHDCGNCNPNGYCDCTKGSGNQGRATVLSNGFPRTPRTDEAMWAAAALGFLLILLALSVLHTRLYRHWRTPHSLYWRDPQQDYDSVADVIHRRLRIAKRRRKRGRRQECVLLPSSSSSDEQ
ncbi:hypothetical protein LDENG_00273060 [Lucifuga dentata]|nr:hypothetical protein LDENG_00273060 [Lucifuga dentata]